MHDVTHITHPDAVPGELVLDHVLMVLQPAHSQALHDLIVAIAGIDHHRPGTAEDQETVGVYPPGAPAIAPQHEKAGFQLDVAVVQDLDLERHVVVPLVASC
jgi:hypothetical protein